VNIHEYQAKQLLAKYGIPSPPFTVVGDISEAKQAIEALCLDKAVIKVQVHAGGRGKAGGVKFAKNPEQILSSVNQLLRMKIVNAQTGHEGVIANQVLLSASLDIAHEYYLSILIDRTRAQAILIASPEGGAEIEETAVTTPDKILVLPLHNDGTIKPYHLLRVVKWMGWEGETAKQGMVIVTGLVRAFAETDASLIEINPLVKTPQGDLLALDAKLSIDDNALFRQKAIAALYDPTQLPVQEARAKKYDLAYVALGGDIGCMVNGAGLAMATMDIIQYYGGKPANFLDVGGGASEEKVAEGFKIILSDPQVKAILVNIFGGIMNCATLAAGIIAAAGELQIHVPLIVRMEGTNVEKGKQLLKDSGMNILIADSLEEAAQRAVASL
jgi:succinyl-CoA synthetase beta subunit